MQQVKNTIDPLSNKRTPFGKGLAIIEESNIEGGVGGSSI
jgi:hypothetical protein